MQRGNNEGFSLIELIIVIAIMAILLLILAPSYLRYVERSRTTTDMENARKIMSAIQIYAADPNVEETLTADYAHRQCVTVFAPDSPTFDPDDENWQGARIDVYAVHALKAAGIVPQEMADHGRFYPIFYAQSRHTWDSYSIEYWADGQGGIAFDFHQEPAGDTFKNMMLGKKD